MLRHANGYWGSLAVLNSRYPQGLDPRHAVWIWRRLLEVLGFIHRSHWCHGDVRPEHALVHPQDHGIRLIGWRAACAGASAQAQALDLMHSARVVQVLLGGSAPERMPQQVPAGLAELITRASEETAFCRQHGAVGLDALLKTMAAAAFGKPTFVPLIL